MGRVCASFSADYAALAERVIANAEKTVLGEAQLQSNLERGIVEAEQQYLATLGEEKLRAMEMPEPELLDALGLSEPEARGAMVLLNLDKFDGTQDADVFLDKLIRITAESDKLGINDIYVGHYFNG